MREQRMTQVHLVAMVDALNQVPLTREVEELRAFFRGITIGDMSTIRLILATQQDLDAKAVTKVRDCRCGSQLVFREGVNKVKCPGCGITTEVLG